MVFHFWGGGAHRGHHRRLTALLTFVYFVAFETTQGGTIGKKLLGLSVHGAGGAAKPTAQQSAIRNSWTLLTIIPF